MMARTKLGYASLKELSSSSSLDGLFYLRSLLGMGKSYAIVDYIIDSRCVDITSNGSRNHATLCRASICALCLRIEMASITDPYCCERNKSAKEKVGVFLHVTEGMRSTLTCVSSCGSKGVMREKL